MSTPSKPRDAGISNRESAAEEEKEREQSPPIDELSEAGESTAEETPPGTQTSRKAGARSSGQKAAAARHADDATPASRKVSGAFGKEE